MKNKLLPVAFLLLAFKSFSQVGVGTLTPSNSAQLDVMASNKGVLIPRVSLSSITDSTTISNGNINSLLVFNTSNSNNIKPGYYYWYDNKWLRIINADDLLTIDTNTTNSSFSVLNGDLILTDSDGNTVSIPLSEINLQETVTNLVYDNTTGVATYTNEAGTLQTVDLSAVVKNFETLTTIAVDNTAGTLTYVDEDGVTNTLNLGDLVKANETVTTLVNNNDGTYTYTNEAGATVTIDVPADVITNFEEIVTNTEVLNQLIENLTNTTVGGNVSLV